MFRAIPVTTGRRWISSTILVTPIPDGTDTYTTPPFPVPDPKEFNDCILVFPAGSGIKPIYVYLKEDPRKLPVLNRARRPAFTRNSLAGYVGIQ